MTSTKETVETQQQVVEVDPDVYERFENRRQETKNAHAPEMSESLFLSALLDTAEAVERGYYDDDE